VNGSGAPGPADLPGISPRLPRIHGEETDVRNDNSEPEGLAEDGTVEPTRGEGVGGGVSEGVADDATPLAGPAVRDGRDGVGNGVDPFDDVDLIRRAQEGDRQALGLLVRRYQRRIFALGIRFFGNSDDAEDLVQDTFVRAWRGLDRFDLSRPFAPWLMRIASNRALTEIATRKRRAGVELDESLAWDGPGADEDLERRELQRKVGRAINELPDDQRMILLLRVSDGMSYRDIAETLEVPIGTVMSRLSRAREAMRQKVKRQ
jgi:RNA polymerase sigma-70 factor (ECF subfamily)